MTAPVARLGTGSSSPKARHSSTQANAQRTSRRLQGRPARRPDIHQPRATPWELRKPRRPQALKGRHELQPPAKRPKCGKIARSPSSFATDWHTHASVSIKEGIPFRLPWVEPSPDRSAWRRSQAEFCRVWRSFGLQRLACAPALKSHDPTPSDSATRLGIPQV